MRKTFYGSPQAIERGLHLLPRLRDEAVIEISPESFDALLAEVDVLEALAREEGTYEPYWCHRLGNLRAAVASARAYGSMGRVSIG